MIADNSLDQLADLIALAKKKGADAADAILVDSASLSVAYRLGALEKLERSESGDVGLRVLIGKRQAMVSSSDRSRAALAELADRAIAMARIVPEDPFCGLADPADLARNFPDLDLCDPVEPAADTLVAMAKTCEEAARAVPGITNSEGAEGGWSRSAIALVASNGFAHAYRATGISLSASVLAGEGTAMERDYDYSSAVYAADLASPETVGRSAGEKAVRRLGARKVKTCQVPVIFDPRIGRGMVSHFASAINGQAIARGTSFLKDKLGSRVFKPGISIVDDPHRRRGLRSRPCDGEGVANKKMEFAADGILTSWVLDLRSARQLGLKTTGHAARGTGGPPSPSVSNLYLAPGPVTRSEMIRDVDSGLYVTELSGMGINGVTGDYSRGAAGFWIEGGEIAYPVSEITIAGNLKQMFLNLTPASDLEFRYGLDAPTLRIDGMTLAGS